MRYVIACFILVLSACGGGGGSSAPKAPSVDTTPSPSITITTFNSGTPFLKVEGTSQNVANTLSIDLDNSSYSVTPNSQGNWFWNINSCDQALTAGDYQFKVSTQDVSVSRSFTIASQTYVKVHFYRHQQDYDGWGVHLWGDSILSSAATQWSAPRAFDCQQDPWVQFWVPIQDEGSAFNFIVHKGDNKNTPDDLSFLPGTFGLDVFIVQGDPTLYATVEEAQLAIDRAGNLSQSLDLAPVEIGNTKSELPDGWANTSAFIEIYVRGYQDSDGDGQGDIKGLIQRLPYLADLGVKGIWLMPITESSDHDHGYAVTNYRAIEKDYGDLSDFQTLLNDAHQLGIGIVLDYVINHSSSANPLFLDASFSENNDKRAWYNFASSDLGWGPWGNGWRKSSDGQFYYAPFSSMMPDFNLNNQAVVDFHLNNLKYWLNMGVDGFRFDAVGVLFESNDGNITINHPDNHVLLAQLNNVINSYDNRYVVCEAPDGPNLYAVDTSCGRAFAFGVQQSILESVVQGSIQTMLFDHLTSTNRDKKPLFLSNHDHFAGDRPMSYLLSQENIDQTTVIDYLKVAASVYLLSSATPFTYYGEEVGQTGAGDDWALRRPMSWTNDIETAGFTTGIPFRSPVDNVATANVQSMLTDDTSLLKHYQKLLKLREQFPILASGEMQLHSQMNAPVLVFSRGDQAIVLINLSSSQQVVTVPRTMNATYQDALQVSSLQINEPSGDSLKITLPAHASGVLINQQTQ